MNNAHPQPPLPPEWARLVECLLDLRRALDDIALALSDYHFSLDSDQRRAAELQVSQLMERARARDQCSGDG